MGTNINEKYEIAYDFYGKVLETVNAESLNERISLAIEKTIESMKILIEDTDALKAYLLSRISREKEEETVSVMLGKKRKILHGGMIIVQRMQRSLCFGIGIASIYLKENTGRKVLLLKVLVAQQTCF